MKALYHKDIDPYLDRLAEELEFKIGSWDKYVPTGKEWYRTPVILEFPLGELARGLLNTLALVGRKTPETRPIDGTERFSAQGIEGKASITMDLFSALMKMRDILPQWRGRIILKQPISKICK